LADTTGSADTLLGDLGELLGADNHGGVGKLALAEDLEETLKQKSRLLINNLRTYGLGNIDHSSLLLGGGFARLFGHEGPQLVNVHRGAVVLVFLIVEMSLTLLSEVAWVTAHKRTAVSRRLWKRANQASVPARQATSSSTYYLTIMIL
jgi:hypothetical protein